MNVVNLRTFCLFTKGKLERYSNVIFYVGNVLDAINSPSPESLLTRPNLAIEVVNKRNQRNKTSGKSSFSVPIEYRAAPVVNRFPILHLLTISS